MMKKIWTKPSNLLAAGVSVLAVVLATVLGVRLDRAIRDEVVKRFEQRQLLLVEQTAAGVQNILDHAVRDLAYLGEPYGPLRLAELGGAAESEFAAWQARAAQGLLLFLRHHPAYAQIRYLDANGREIVGVDRDARTMRVIPPDELRSQAQRDFFVETMALGEGEVYISRPEAAQGHGGVGADLLTVYLATPIFDNQGGRQGIVVLNLAADAIRDPIVNLSIEEGVDAWLLDETGVELVNATHPELEGSNAYERVRQSGDEHLEALTEDMLSGEKGTAIYLWPTEDSPEKRVGAYAPVRLAQGRLWSVGTSVTYASVMATYSQTHRVLLFLGGTIAIVVLIGAILAVRSGHRRAVAEERARRAEELEALLETSRAITAQLELDELLQSVVEQGCRLLRAEIGGLYLVDKSSGDLELAAHHGYRGEYVGVRLRPGEGVAGRVLLSDEPLVMRDYQHWEGRSRQWVSGAASSVMGVPIERGAEIVGVLVFAEPGRARIFDERDIRLANLFAGQASVALENARLYAQAQREIAERRRAEEALRLRVEQLAALSRASQAVTASLELDQVLSEIVSLASGMVAADYTSVVLVDETGRLGQSAENLPGVPALEYRIRDEGLTRWIVRAQRAVVVDEIGEDGTMLPDLGAGAPRRANPILVEAGVRSLAGLPLLIQDRLLGVLYLHSLRPGAFHDQLPVLTAFANQVAIAIENARLHQELQDYAHHLEQRVQERAAQLQAQYAQLEAILRSVSDGIVVTDTAGEIIEANPLAQTWLARSLSPEDAARLREAIGDLARKAQERPERVLELTGLDLELRAAPIAGSGVEGAATVVAIHDVSHLKTLDRMKSQFVSNVSHELRTPITTIKLYAALMRDAPPEKMREYLEALTREADWQARLVEDILEISRIEAGRLEMKPRPIPLDELIEMTVANYEAAAREHGLALEHVLEEPSPTALADVGRMTQVLDNLVMNAIRYTPAGGRVVISAAKREDRGRAWATVTVRDTGIGIPEEELPHIFERFFRGEQPRTMQISGTGLGLAIVKEIVELHGGRVTAESQEGVGSTFTVWLPLAEEGEETKGRD